MQKPFFTVLCLLTASACTSHYGSYAKVTDSYNAQMADDSAKELVTLYPPASTHLQISHETGDAYGIELVKSLRESGYAIEEGKSTATAANNASATTADNEGSPAAILPIHYIIDNIGNALYRVTISAGDHTINRVYSVSGDDMLPVGAWTRKE